MVNLVSFTKQKHLTMSICDLIHRALLILTVPQNPPKKRNSNEDPFFMYFKGETSASRQRAENRILTFLKSITYNYK